MAEPRLQPVPPQLRARPARPGHQRRLLVRHPARPRRGDQQPLRPVVEPVAIRRGGPGPELRDPARRVRGLHRPLHRHQARRRPGSSTGSSTRAGRRCCGISTTTTTTRPAATSAPRRPTSRCTSCTPTTTGRSSVDNLTGWTQRGLSVESKVYSVDGTLLDDQTANGDLGRQPGSRAGRPASRRCRRTRPPTPAETYFVELLLHRHGQVVDRNVYWLSTQQDVVNWDTTIGNPQATMTQFANLTQLQSLAQPPPFALPPDPSVRCATAATPRPT